ncbi:MAG: outer membrane protein assembly factor BamD [Acidobacteriia bacterium]|nr:outer membrane protein assembly factor BamD [Terriglobia bacterium]
MLRKVIRNAAVVAAAVVLLSSCRHRYENPITKETQQPDKVLFDKAMNDIEHGRFEIARLTLNTLMNTYESSEYLAKAKLLVADSWYREGGGHGLAQAEAEYKDFILFYPAMEEAAEAQEKVCKIHYQQMEKADRDPVHEIRAEEECRNVLANFPNSKFAPEAQQLLRNIQENMAEGEYKVGRFYLTKGSYPAAANRLQTLAEEYPLYSKADEALWSAAESYERLGTQFRQQQIRELSKLVREYPLSARADAAKQKLQELEAAAPEADPVALARMQYELENREGISFLSKFWGAFSMHPNLTMSAKSGTPSMEGFRPTIPVSVSRVAAGTLGTSGDVTISAPGDASALENNPDARAAAPGQPVAAPNAPADPTATAQPGDQGSATAQTPTNGKKPKKQPKPKAAKKQKTPPPTAPGAPPDTPPKQ